MCSFKVYKNRSRLLSLFLFKASFAPLLPSSRPVPAFSRVIPRKKNPTLLKTTQVLMACDQHHVNCRMETLLDKEKTTRILNNVKPQLLNGVFSNVINWKTMIGIVRYWSAVFMQLKIFDLYMYST